MKFALLGVDDDALRVARALCRSAAHQLSVAFEAEPRLAEIRTFAPRVSAGDAWESLLALAEIEAVVVARADDQQLRDEQLRKLVQEGLPLVVMHPICDTLVAYELEMIRQEAAGTIVPYLPGQGHGALAELAAAIEQGDKSPLGAVEQVLVARHLRVRDRDHVLRQFRRDARLLRDFVGDIESVNATGGAGSDPWANLSVSLRGARGLTARWSVEPAAGDRLASVTLVASRGKAAASEFAPGQWALEPPAQDPPWSDDLSEDETHRIAAALRGADADATAWAEACRDLDLADQVETSLRRKRTIELHRDENPEEHAFKGVMAAGSCLLLVIALLGLLVFAVVEGFRMPLIDDPSAIAPPDDADQLPRWHLLVRLWPVYPLLAFLALQLLLFVAKRESKARQSKSATATKNS